MRYVPSERLGTDRQLISLLRNAAESPHQAWSVQFLSDRDDMEADFLQLLVIDNLTPIEDVSRLNHRLVNAFIVHFDKLVPFTVGGIVLNILTTFVRS